ncbi:DUF6113 family protein [Streptomyces sp. NPDC004959]|uniref:DUF6113 family protein n=1 Tax=unclassified Streptomyces TaxID=2593676 RepID=UPI0004CC428D|nr:DUF6113 family protein [Streptomyces sp. NRRL F-5630]
MSNKPKVPAQRTAPEGHFLAAPPKPARIAGYVGGALLGLVTGLAGALVHAALPPGGLALALAALAGLCYGGAQLARTLAGGLIPALGWLLAVVLLTTTRPEGDYVFGAGLGSYGFLLGGMAVAVICATGGRPGGWAGPGTVRTSA